MSDRKKILILARTSRIADEVGAMLTDFGYERVGLEGITRSLLAMQGGGEFEHDQHYMLMASLHECWFDVEGLLNAEANQCGERVYAVMTHDTFYEIHGNYSGAVQKTELASWHKLDVADRGMQNRDAKFWNRKMQIVYARGVAHVGDYFGGSMTPEDTHTTMLNFLRAFDKEALDYIRPSFS